VLLVLLVVSLLQAQYFIGSLLWYPQTLT
jgi:hypothetical protein